MSTDAHKSSVNTEEANLIRRVCRGERESFYALVQPYQRALFVAALAILKNPADAEEVTQEAVLKALLNLVSFRGESKFSTWLIQITINEARLKLRNDRRHLYDSVDEPIVGQGGEPFRKEFADLRHLPSDALQRKELREALQRGLASLPPKYRVVLILRDVEDLTIQETSRVLGISPGSVKTRLLRARLRMREALTRACECRRRLRGFKEQGGACFGGVWEGSTRLSLAPGCDQFPSGFGPKDGPKADLGSDSSTS